MDTMDRRGNKIRERRKELGLNMLQASQRCGVTEATISRLEAGKIPNASFNVLSKVARGLGMSLDDLYTEDDESPSVRLVAGGTA